MRPCTPLLSAALIDPNFQFIEVDLFTVQLTNNVFYYFTSLDKPVKFDGNVYISAGPFMRYSEVNITNTMTVPTMTIKINGTTASWAGGLDIMSQAHNGVFDGAIISWSRLYLPRDNPDDQSLGTIDVFTGQNGPANIDGTVITLRVKGANNLLSQYGPKNIYQVQCNNTFCDTMCTLLRADFTDPFVVGTSPPPTPAFVAWESSPVSPELYELGTITFTSGAASGSRRGVESVDATGISFEYPLYNTPAPGDTFTAFQGCTKDTIICESRGNIQNWRGFKFTPPAETGV